MCVIPISHHPAPDRHFFNKGGNGYADSLMIAYEFDAAGDVGFTDSYVGIQYLGSDGGVDTASFVKLAVP